LSPYDRADCEGGEPSTAVYDPLPERDAMR
jgi:hypothetical protein